MWHLPALQRRVKSSPLLRLIDVQAFAVVLLMLARNEEEEKVVAVFGEWDLLLFSPPAAIVDV